MAYPNPLPVDDFDIRDCGSIILLSPISASAAEWAEDHLPEDAQRFGGGIVIERRYFENIYYGIVGAGLTIS